MLYPVTVQELPFKLRLAKKYIEQCLEYSPVPHTYQDVVAALIADNGKRLFLQMEEGLVKGMLILDIYTDLNTKVLNIFMMSHDSDYLYEDKDSEQVMELAGALGAKVVTFYGRKGFLKTLSPKGWKVQQVVMTKEVL